MNTWRLNLLFSDINFLLNLIFLKYRTKIVSLELQNKTVRQHLTAIYFKYLNTRIAPSDIDEISSN